VERRGFLRSGPAEVRVGAREYIGMYKGREFIVAAVVIVARSTVRINGYLFRLTS